MPSERLKGDATLSERQFLVADCCRRLGSPTSARVAEDCGLTIAEVEDALGELAASGLVDGANALTDKGLSALEPYKVDNAVIMAAGMSTRFAPISYERPKGVLRVRGEVLVERQIRQLHDAGIDDVTVVVGYKKEEFFYLEDLLGVKIVVNDEYATRNNNSTLRRVEPILGNTYICSSDDYFVENPFERYVWRSYYAAVFEEGETPEWCLETAGPDDLIVGATVGGADSWVMLGHAYWDRAFSAAFSRILDEVYDAPETAGKLWEDIYIEHVGELPMVMRRYPHGSIWEFDSLDELRDFDPAFIENVDSKILDNICRVLGCERADVRDIEPIKQGLTNMSFKFTVSGSPYVYRHPGVGTDEIISRESEAFSQGVARELGIDRTFIYEEPREGWKVSRFIEGCVPFDYHNEDHVREAMRIGRTLHQSGFGSGFVFDVYQKALDIVALLDAGGRSSFADFDELAGRIESVHRHVEADGVAPCLCHNDFYDPNFLVHEGGVDLIDWEYSGMSDYASDLGTFICCSDYTTEEAKGVVREYFQREPTRAELAHCMGYVALSSYYWFVWAIYKEMTGDPVGEYLYLWYRYAKSYADVALGLYERGE